jgi:TatD DNase family protein
LYIGITGTYNFLRDMLFPARKTDDVLVSGVITFSSNENTSELVRRMFAESPSPRIILETDAPFMVPANIYASLPTIRGRLPLCHTAMIPWTAEAVATIAGEGWDVDRVLELGKVNANNVYGI